MKLTSPRLLVVDDDINQRDSLAEIFKQGKFDVDSVETGKQALEKILKINYDAVLIDLKLADMSGLDVLRGIKKKAPDTECILLTGFASQESAIAAINLGAFTYFQKPYQIEQLLLSVRQATEKRRAAIELRSSEERFRLIFEQSPIPYQSLDEDGKIIEVNAAWLKVLGYEREEVAGKWFGDFLPESQKQLYTDHFKNFIEAGVSHGIEFDILDKNGSPITFSFDGNVIYDKNGKFLQTNCILTNITERKNYERALQRRAEQITVINEMGQALAQSQELHGIFNIAYAYAAELVDRPNFGISLIDESRQTLNAAFYISDGQELDVSLMPPLPLNKKKQTGRSGAINTSAPIIIDDLAQEISRSKTVAFFGSGETPKSALYVPMSVEGKVIGLLEAQSYEAAAYDKSQAELMSVASNAIGLAIVNAQKIETMKLQSAALNSAANAIIITDEDGILQWVNPAFCELTGYSAEECLGHRPRELVRSKLNADSDHEHLWETIRAGKVWRGTLINRRKNGSLYTEEQTITPVKNASGEISHFIGIKQDVTERDQRERELTVLANISAALRVAVTREEMTPILLEELIVQLKIEGATLETLNSESGELTVEQGSGIWTPLTDKIIPPGKGLSAEILRTGSPYLNSHISQDSEIFMPELFTGCHAVAGAPLKTQNQIIGLIWIGSQRDLDEKDLRLLISVADMAANAIHRATLHEQTQAKVKQLAALRTIDQTINSSLDLRVTLGMIVKQAPQIIAIDALDILIYNKRTLNLDFAAGAGFRTKTIEETHVRIGSGLAGKAALERRMVAITDLHAAEDEFTRVTLAKIEEFTSYHAIPLIVKGEIQGVLEVFHRTPFRPDSEWLEIVDGLATQAAIAIDNSIMFLDLRRSNIALTQAYDETIEGWAKALELRDRETEGHSRRVTDRTLAMARAAGVNDEMLVHIARGALLHDIGKLAIPDNVMNKTGKLTEAEWAIIRDHPKAAFDLLYPIRYLRPALDIPYCHHEKWDGSGYPRGLKGEDIPLAARLFAVVDVFDALTSDRPYRKAWEVEKALAYIREQAGEHFEPRAVDIFIMTQTS